jgi:hypothetical protein
MLGFSKSFTGIIEATKSKRKRSINMGPLLSPENRIGARRLVSLVAEMLSDPRRIDDAIAAASGAVALDSTYAPALNSLAAALSRQPGREKDQAQAASAALILDSSDASAWHNLSIAETRLYQWEKALHSAERSVSFCSSGDPGYPYYPMQAAFVAGLLRDHQKTLAYLTLTEQAASGLDPQARRRFEAECSIARAIVYALQGKWALHFEQLRRRHDLSTAEGNPLTIAHKLDLLWKPGLPVKKRAVVVLEWGLGDQIQFARMIDRIRIAGVEHVTVACSAPLVRLMRTLSNADDVIGHEALDLYDAYQRSRFLSNIGDSILVSVVDLLEYTHHAGLFPLGSWRGPYLKAPQQSVIHRESGKIAVAFSWQGDPNQTHDFMRRIPFGEFAKWASANRNRYTFHSVQTKFGGYCEPWEGWPDDVPVEDLGAGIRDMADAARAISACDVFVGQCGGNLHLAGALGHPAVALLGLAHDWRWDMAEPLYGFSLVKQTTLGDWPSAFDQLNRAITEQMCSASDVVKLKAVQAGIPAL